jgi:hypothetical protein
LGTCEPSCIARSAKPFFIIEARDQQKVMGCIAALEPSLVGRWGPELWYMRQRRSPPWLGGEVQSHGTHGSVGALLIREARSGAMGHVVALEPDSAGRQGLEL